LSKAGSPVRFLDGDDHVDPVVGPDETTHRPGGVELHSQGLFSGTDDLSE
jgi:hypothetical protein